MKLRREHSMKKGCFSFTIIILLLALIVVFAGRNIIDVVLRQMYPRSYEELVQNGAANFSLDENLVYALIKAESKFDKDAVSHAGAVGLMQLTPETFKWINEKQGITEENTDIYDPQDNIDAGCALLRLLLDHYGNLETALSAYNAGMGNVSSWLQNEQYSSDGMTLHTIPFPETREYTKRVQENYSMYQSLYSTDTVIQ